MEEEETVSILSRKELRKQKLMEYLAGKGKLKQPNTKPYLRDDCKVNKKPVTFTQKVVMVKENKAPADKFSTKIKTLAVQSTKQTAGRGAFSVTNKVNVKASILTGRPNINCPSATGGPAKPKFNHNPALVATFTATSSKSNPNAASHLKKQPNSRIPSSDRASSNAARTAVTKINSRFSSSSNATWSRPTGAVSARISLGPMVKTKTGLIPAMIQPRNSQNQNLIHTSAAAADPTTAPTTSVANKVQSRTVSSVSVSQRSATAPRKTLPTTAQHNHERTRAWINVQNRNKSNSQPLLGKHSQPSCKTQLSSGLKSTSTSSKCTTAPIKPEGRVGAAGQPTDRSTKQRSVGEGQKNGQTCKVASRTSSGPVSRCSSRAVSVVMRAAVAELGGKSKTIDKKGHISANAPPPQTGIKRISAPVLSQTVPRPVRTISYTGQATHTKTPKVPVRVVPQTEAKKLTAAQEERMKKLKEWREANGISYKRPPMPVKAQVRCTVAMPQPFWGTMNEEDEAHSLICAVDRSLADCIKLLGEGCPPDQVKEVLSRLPTVSKKFAKYWICQVRLMEQEGNLDVLPVFEEAVGVVLEPVDKLRNVVFEILKKKDEIQASEENKKEEDQIPTGESSHKSINNSPMMTPKCVRALICGEKGNSSVVKFKITATPCGPPSQQKEPVRVNGQEVRFFTPVRRSVRIERSSLRYPRSLQDHDLCVASYNELISEEDNEKSEKQEGVETSLSSNKTQMYIYRQNEALEDKVFVQLVFDKGV